MALRGLSFGEEDTFVSKEDDAYNEDHDAARSAGATVFVWTNVPSSIMARIADMSQVIETEQFSTKQLYKTQNSQKHREAVKYACKRIDNFKDRNDQPIVFEPSKIFENGQMISVLPDEILDRIPLSIINEFGQKIISTQSLTEEQAKNSEALLSRLVGLGTTSVTDATSKSEDSADMTKETAGGIQQETESPPLDESIGKTQ